MKWAAVLKIYIFESILKNALQANMSFHFVSCLCTLPGSFRNIHIKKMSKNAVRALHVWEINAPLYRLPRQCCASTVT